MLDVNARDWESQVLKIQGPVLVDFWHDTCTWCNRLEPGLLEVAQEFSGKLKFVRFNVLSSDENSHVGHQYGIKGTPTLILFCNGRVLQQLVGYRPKEKLRTEVQEMLTNFDDCLKQSTPLKT